MTVHRKTTERNLYVAEPRAEERTQIEYVSK